MDDIARKALSYWALGDAKISLIAQRENHVYRVDVKDKVYALRLHRVGYRTDQELQSELDWLFALSNSGATVATPIPSTKGAFLVHVDGVQIDLQSWIEGQTMADQEPDVGLIAKLGAELAHLHNRSDNWLPPENFDRARWDRAGLLGKAPLWDRFWKNPKLLPKQREQFLQLRKTADLELAEIEGVADFGLIHADAVGNNVLVQDGSVILIDFDDAGWGFRLFDLATVLGPFAIDPRLSEFEDALLDGYRQIRPLDMRGWELMLMLRSLTYVGWNITREHEDATGARHARFMARSSVFIERYLASK